MTNYFDAAYTLTQEVKNPSHDKRRKYGPEGIPSLPAGTVIFKLNGQHYDSFYDEQGNSLAPAHNPFGKELAKHIAPYEPKTWQHALVFRYGAVYQIKSIVTELIESGALTLGQLLRAAAVVDARLEEPTQVPQEASPEAGCPPAC